MYRRTRFDYVYKKSQNIGDLTIYRLHQPIVDLTIDKESKVMGMYKPKKYRNDLQLRIIGDLFRHESGKYFGLVRKQKALLIYEFVGECYYEKLKIFNLNKYKTIEDSGLCYIYHNYKVSRLVGIEIDNKTSQIKSFSLQIRNKNEKDHYSITDKSIKFIGTTKNEWFGCELPNPWIRVLFNRKILRIFLNDEMVYTLLNHGIGEEKNYREKIFSVIFKFHFEIHKNEYIFILLRKKLYRRRYENGPKSEIEHHLLVLVNKTLLSFNQSDFNSNVLHDIRRFQIHSQVSDKEIVCQLEPFIHIKELTQIILSYVL